MFIACSPETKPDSYNGLWVGDSTGLFGGEFYVEWRKGTVFKPHFCVLTSVYTSHYNMSMHLHYLSTFFGYRLLLKFPVDID